jgi:hypothetical protein
MLFELEGQSLGTEELDNNFRVRCARIKDGGWRLQINVVHRLICLYKCGGVVVPNREYRFVQYAFGHIGFVKIDTIEKSALSGTCQ